MKAKYKLGSLVQFGTEKETRHGLVTGIIARQDGYSYEVAGTSGEVDEDNITASFRPVAARRQKAVRATKTRKNSVRAHREEQDEERAPF